MEAVLLNSSPDQSLSPYKHQIRNPRKNNRPLISHISQHPSDNFALSNFHNGLLCTPPLSYSFPPPIPVLRPQNHHHQPPLLPLPLPILMPRNQNSSRGRGLSCPPVNRKIKNRSTRDQSLTPKKSKPKSTTPTKSKQISSGECLIVASTNRLGPDPKDIPKDVVSRVLSSSSSIMRNATTTNNSTKDDQVQVVDTNKFSGSVVFTLSPPPSSLPLPTFSLRPKLSCNAEAAGVDAGATDSLRRLLRL